MGQKCFFYNRFGVTTKNKKEKIRKKSCGWYTFRVTPNPLRGLKPNAWGLSGRVT